ncbi:VOC family protein [Paludibaculum fermentans]|uniref:VOC family protein n=1 Tax=Paludibaculum fermentans TaxID=1473598 RepID=UPI003EB82864
MKLISYLTFDGQAEEAFKFYEKALGGKITAMMPHAGTPAEAHVPKEQLAKIMHARLEVGDQVLMASDAMVNHYKQPAGISVSVNVKSAEEAERIFNALADGAKAVTMPIQETFWSPKFGMLTDRFGIPWMVNCEPAS